MSTVTLSIGPKSYTVACADGQEAHIKALGAMIAEKYSQLGSARAPLEAQNVLFAALFLADELAETRRGIAQIEAAQETIARLEAEVNAARETGAGLEAEIAAARETSAGLEADLAAARETSAGLEAELAAARAQATLRASEPVAAVPPTIPQFDLFGAPPAAPGAEPDLAARLEALAAAAEASAAALEAAAASA